MKYEPSSLQQSARVGRLARAYKAAASLAAHWLVAARTCSLPRLPVAANEEPAPAAEAANEGVAIGEFIVQEGGNMIVPYCESPVVITMGGRKVTALQLIDEVAANDLAADMSGLLGRLKGMFVGRPIFAGHPYHPDASEAAKWADKRSRGNVKSIEVGNESMTLVCKYNNLGTGEVEDSQFAFHSPQWRLRPVMAANGQQLVKNGMPVFRPFALHSAGLTNNPNIPVPPLVAANEDAPATPALSIDLNKIVAALKEAGLIKEGDDETAILNAIGGAARELQWARERKEREEKEISLMRETIKATAANEMGHEDLISLLVGCCEGERTSVASLQTQLDAANEAVKAEREARAELALEPLIKAGKITGAERGEKLTLLVEAANETAFADVLKEISKASVKLKTKATHSADLSGSQRAVMAANEQGERSRQRAEAVHACLQEITRGRAAKDGDQERAWNLARTRNPELFK